MRGPGRPCRTTYALLWLVSSSLAAAPTGVVYDPPGVVEMGMPLPMAVRVEGLLDGEASVVLHYRAPGGRRYVSAPMVPVGQGLYRYEIPGTATNTTEIRYYVEVREPGGSYRTSIGSAPHPMSALLMPPPPEATPHKRVAGVLVLGALMVLAVVATLRERRDLGRRGAGKRSRAARRRVRDREAVARREVVRLQQAICMLGLEGSFRPQQDPASPDAPPPEAQSEVAPDAIQEQLTSFARRIGALFAASWILTRRDGNHRRGQGPFDPFEDGREPLRRIRDRLEAGRTEEAMELLESLRLQVKSLDRVVAEVDAGVSLVELEQEIAEARGVPAEFFGRLLEYYGRFRGSSPATRRKLVCVGMALLDDDDVDAESPEATREALELRGLLQDRARPIPAYLLERALALRESLLADDGSRDDAELGIEKLHIDLGTHFYSAAGLAEVLSLEGLRRRVGAEGGTSAAEDHEDDPATAADDPAAVALLREIEVELQTLVDEQAASLDPVELEALVAVDANARDLVIRRCAILRHAVDRLAATHAPEEGEDDDAPALPVAFGSTLLRTAACLVDGLQAEIQQDLKSGEVWRAKEVTQFLHRFSQVRLRLASLANLPITGADPETLRK